MTEDFTSRHLTPVLTMQQHKVKSLLQRLSSSDDLVFFPHETQWSDCFNEPQNIKGFKSEIILPDRMDDLAERW